MDLLDFLATEIASLPKKRPNDEPFDSFLHRIFSEYVEAVNQLSDTGPISTAARNSRPIIEAVCKKLEKATEEYLRGFPHAAYKHVKSGIKKLGTAFNQLQLGSGYSGSMREFERLYRMRIGKLDRFSRADLFHVPFESRHKVTTKRYSISGLPSLYLGGSLWVCWEEMQRPDFHTIQLARFRYSQPVTLLDFGFRPRVIALLRKTGSNLFDDAWISGYLTCWPLLAACSVRVLHPGMPFVPEYIVPQLLLQYLRNETELDGLRYFSTHVDQYEASPWAAMNYVFPVQEQAASGYCPKLRDKLVLSTPAAWSILEKSDIATIPMEAESWGVPVTDDQTVPYFKTEFFNCERKLEGLPVSRL